MSILIVEDSVEFRKLMTVKFANKFKAPLWEADSGKDASLVLQQHSVDVVVSDFHMPNGDGLWLHKFMTHHFPNTPLIVFTSTPEQAVLPQGSNLKAVIAKPDFSSLFSQLASLGLL